MENILHRQSPRNNLIAAIFQLCGLVERSGQGMNLIYEQSIREAKPLPCFDGSDAYYTKLTLVGKVVSTQMLTFVKKMNDERLGSDWEAIETNDRKQQILALINKNGQATTSQLADHLTLTQVRIRAILKELVAAGLIEKIGNYDLKPPAMLGRAEEAVVGVLT